MTVEIDEGRHRLRFDAPWVGLKWDDHPMFRRGIQRVPRVKAVDVVAFHPGEPLALLLEFKDPAQALTPIEGEGAYVDELTGALAAKVVGTLAGVQWSRPAEADEADLDQLERIAEGLRDAGVLVLVVLEVPRSQITTVPMAVQRRLRRALAWMPATHVAVIAAGSWVLPDSTCDLEAA